MFVAGHFYGAISIAQAYAEALSSFLCEKYHIRGNRNDPQKRWQKLFDGKIVGTGARDAAIALMSDRNDFHHLNKDVERDFRKMEARAGECVNLLYTIESEVFAHSFEAGKIRPKHPERWPDEGDGLTSVNLRQKW